MAIFAVSAMLSIGTVANPVLDGEIGVGSSINAPREPSAPSAVTLIAAIVRWLSARLTVLYCASRARRLSLLSRTMTHNRTPSRPSAAACL